MASDSKTPFGGQSQGRWGNDTLNANETMRDFLLADLSGKPCNTADARKKGMLLLAFVEVGGGQNDLNAIAATPADATDSTGGQAQATRAASPATAAVGGSAETLANSASLLRALQQFADGYKEGGKLTVWAVSESDEATTRAFAEANAITLPLLLDRDRYQQMGNGITTLPTVFLATGQGQVVRRSRGYNIESLSEMSAHVAKFAELETPVAIGTPTVS